MATQQDMLILQSQIDDLNTNIYTLKKNQADLSLKIDELNRNLTSFSENSRDLNIEIKNLSSKIDDIQITTDKKITQLTKNSQKLEKDDEQYKEMILFYKGVSLYSAQKYDLAIETFKDFILKFPKAENLNEAYFYIAESLFQVKNYKEAAIFYARIISSYPSYSKMGYVRLKYAKSLIELKDKTKHDEANTYLRSVVADFPETPEAMAAKEILNTLNPKQTTAIKNRKHKN